MCDDWVLQELSDENQRWQLVCLIMENRNYHHFFTKHRLIARTQQGKTIIRPYGV